MNPEMLRKLKLMQEKMGSDTGQAITGGLNAVNSAIPNIQQNEIIKGKTGFGNASESLIQAGADAIIPGAGAALGILSKVGSAVEGDGASTGKNIAGELINPLSNINDLAEGRVKYAIPIVGSFLKAQDSKNKLEFDKQKQDASMIDQARQRGAAYPSTGVTGVTRFELGGSIPLSKDAKLLQGNTHQQGGIPITKQGNQIAEAENNEVMVNTPNATHIASDKVINPKTGNSFAIDIAMTKKKQGKYEKLMSLRKGDDSITNVINKSKKETEVLMQGQEQVKQQMLAAQLPQGQPQQGIPMEGQPMQMPMMKYGGTIGDGSGMSMEMQRQAEEEARLKLLQGFTPTKLDPNVNLDGTTNPQMVNTLNWNPFKTKVMDVKLPVTTEKQGKMPDYGESKFVYPDNINEIIEEGRGYSVGSSQEWDKKPNKMTSPIISNVGETVTTTDENNLKNIGKNLKPFVDKLNNIPADILVGTMNAFDRRKDKAPQKNLMDYQTVQKVDYGSQRTEAQRQALATRKGLAAYTTDSTTNRAASLATLGEQISGINRVNEAETNMNAQILQETLAKNGQIQGMNNETKYGNEALSQQFKDDIRAKNLQLASRIANETSQRKRDANADKLANTQNKLAILAQDNPNVVLAGLESGMFKDIYSPEEIKEMTKKYKKIIEDSKGSSTTTTTTTTAG